MDQTKHEAKQRCGFMTMVLGKPRSAYDPAAAACRQLILRLPNLSRSSIVKLLHLVQTVHLGRRGDTAFRDRFKATVLGPYNERLSRLAMRMKREFLANGTIRPIGGEPSPALAAAIDEVSTAFQQATDADVVATTSVPGGAWHALWEPSPETTMAIGDPRRLLAKRTPVGEGPLIEGRHMLAEFDVLTGREANGTPKIGFD